MSNFIKIELADAKDPNGIMYINAENINWIAKSGRNTKLKMNSGDIFTLKVPSYEELSALLGLPSGSLKE